MLSARLQRYVPFCHKRLIESNGVNMKKCIPEIVQVLSISPWLVAAFLQISYNCTNMLLTALQLVASSVFLIFFGLAYWRYTQHKSRGLTCFVSEVARYFLPWYGACGLVYLIFVLASL